VGSPGRTSTGTSSRTSTPASTELVGSTSAVIIVLIAGRIGMPVDWVQASTPFIPRWAESVRLRAVRPAPTARARTATVVRKAYCPIRLPSDGRRISCASTGRRNRRSRSALVTTLTELIAMAAAASTGSSSSPSAQ
jgi:hypothetical protein